MRKLYTKHSIQGLVLILLSLGIVMSTGGCKNKEKLAQETAAKEYAEKVAKARAELQAILDDSGTMPLTEMERRLNDIKSQNLNDPQVNKLIAKVEDKINLKKAKQNEIEEKLQEQAKIEMQKRQYDYINNYFYQVAAAPDVNTANAKISEALKLYASESVPVLIVIHKQGEEIDYDKPTTIGDYLNYIKDQKKYNNNILEAKMDSYGQVTELVLIKK